MITVDRDGELFVLTMDDGENRWNTSFTREFDEALNEIENSEGPAALVTRSTNEKFFSNGLDLEWITTKDLDHPGGDRAAFGPEVMALFARLMTFPIPTVCAINGHAFGAGLMIALCHDVRLMRRDRGFLCANEVEIGFAIPEPELALFRHKLPAPAFFETVQLAKRWSGEAALAAGIVEQIADQDQLFDLAKDRAQSLVKLAKNREVFQWMKEHTYGENAAINGIHGPAHMLRNPSLYASGPGKVSSS